MTRTVPDAMEVLNTATLLIGIWLFAFAAAYWSSAIVLVGLSFIIVSGAGGLTCHSGWWWP